MATRSKVAPQPPPPRKEGFVEGKPLGGPALRYAPDDRVPLGTSSPPSPKPDRSKAAAGPVHASPPTVAGAGVPAAAPTPTAPTPPPTPPPHPTPITDPTASPPVSTMTTTDLVLRHSACLVHAADPAAARKECALLKAVALQVIAETPEVPTVSDLQSVVVLAAMEDGQVTRAVLNKLVGIMDAQTTLDPVLVLGVAAALRLGVNAATGNATFIPRRRADDAALLASVINTAACTVVDNLVGAGGDALSSVVTPMTSAVASALPSTVSGWDLTEVTADAADGVAATITGAATGAATGALPEDVVAQGAADPDAAPSSPHLLDMVSVVVATVTPVVSRVMATLCDTNFRSDTRDRLLFVLCKLLDAVVDVMPPEDGPGGLGTQWRKDMTDALDDLTASTANADNLYLCHYVKYAKQAVAHVREDADAQAAALLQPTTDIIDGVLQLVSAAAAKDLKGVLDAVWGMKATVGAFHDSRPKPWYNKVRLLADMAPDRLLAAIAEGAPSEDFPPHVSFFVVERLDAVARTPLPDGVDPARSPQVACTSALGMVFMEKTALDVDSKGESLRAHVLHRLHRLCRCPTPAVQEEAKNTLRAVFAYVEEPPLWKRALTCGAVPAPVAVQLQLDTGVYLGSVDSLAPFGGFYDTHDVGTGPLYGSKVHSDATVGDALAAVDRVEAVVEALRLNAARQLAAEGVSADLELFVLPMATESKDSPPGAGSSLDALVRDEWLTAAAGSSSPHVALLHGHSGSGKSLYAARLEADLWGRYRRHQPTCWVPIWINLPAVVDAEKAAVEETLLERCGVGVRVAGKDPHRRWLLIMDGYDEVSGSTNFVASNKLATALPSASALFTCRTEYLESKPKYGSLFVPPGPGGSRRLTEVYIQPFNAGLVRQFFEAWEAKHPPTAKVWPASKYVAFIKATAGLAELAETPFVLRAMADSLPRLDVGGRRVTRADVYATFVESWWEASAAKLRRAWPPGLLPEYNPEESYMNYSKALAVTMLSTGHLAAESSSGLFTFLNAAANPWARFFNDDNPVTRVTRQGSPLRAAGRMHSFIHKSLAEFFTALAAWDDIVALVVSPAAALDALHHSTLNAFAFGEQPAVTSFVVDLLSVHARTRDAAIDALKMVVVSTRDRGDLLHAGGNAAGVLAQAGVALCGVKWQGVVLRDAVLSDAAFINADLRGADLRGASLERACFDGANLDGANLEGVSVGQLPYLAGHTGEVWDVKYSPSGRLLASGDNGGTVIVWDTVSATAVATLSCGSDVTCVCFASESCLLVCGGGPEVRVLEAHGEGPTWTQVASLKGFTGRAECLAAAGDLVAAGGGGNGVCLWRLATRARAGAVDIGENVFCVGLSPNGGLLAVGYERCATVWDVASGEKLNELPIAMVVCLAFSPDGCQLTVGTIGRSLYVYDVGTWEETAEMGGHRKLPMKVSYSGDGLTLVSADAAGIVHVWDVLKSAPLARLTGHRGAVRGAAISPDGHRIASGGDDQSIRLWEVGERAAPSTALLRGPPSAVQVAAFFPNGRHIVTACKRGELVVWDVFTGDAVMQDSTFSAGAKKATDVCVSPDGALVAAVAGANVVVWRVDPLEVVAEFSSFFGVQTAKFSPDGRLLVAAGMLSVRVWSVGAWNCVAEVKAHEDLVWHLVFTPDGARFVTVDMRNVVHVWDASTREVVGTLETRGASMKRLAVSPDGRTLVAAGRPHTIYVWDLASLNFMTAVEGHEKGVTAVAFSPNGRWLVSGGDDCTVKVWSVATRSAPVCAATLRGHTHRVTATLFTPGGDVLVTAGKDRSVRMWNVTSDGNFIPVGIISKNRSLSFVGANIRGVIGASGTRLVMDQCGALEAAAVDKAPLSEKGTVKGVATGDAAMVAASLADLHDGLKAVRGVLATVVAALASGGAGAGTTL